MASQNIALLTRTIVRLAKTERGFGGKDYYSALYDTTASDAGEGDRAFRLEALSHTPDTQSGLAWRNTKRLLARQIILPSMSTVRRTSVM